MDNENHRKPGKVLPNLFVGKYCGHFNTCFVSTISFIKVTIMIVGSISENKN